MSLTAEIIAVGTELLLGDIVNTNAQYIAQGLASMGITVHFQTVVGDNQKRLVSVLGQALSRSNIVITTGGLGPTGDDLTKETVCNALGLELKVDEKRLEELKKRFSESGREMTENNIKQVMFPECGIIFDNPNGTAPGLCIHKGNQFIIMLPGPPFEMVPMFDNSVKPFLQDYCSEVIHSLSVEFFGIGESALETKLAHLMNGENPTVAPYAKQGQVRVRITAKATSVEAAKALIAPILTKIEGIAGEYIYGYDGETLESAAVKLLQKSNLTVATAESCTGGLIAQRITSVPGCSEVFSTGFVTYSADAKIDRLHVEERYVKKYGVVSSQTAALMAIGAAVQSGSDIGLSVTGVAGPDTLEGKPVGTVYIGLYGNGKVWVKKLNLAHFSTNRESIRTVAASNALDMLRRYADLDFRYTLDAICLDPEDVGISSKHADGGVKNARISPRGRTETILLVISFIALLCSLAYFVFSIATATSKTSDYLGMSSVSIPSMSSDGSVASQTGYLPKYDSYAGANSDLIGWLTVSETNISTPLVRGSDNSYYNGVNFYKQEDKQGTPFVSCKNSADKIDQNTVVFGQNTKDSSAFTDLLQYKDIAFLKSNPVIECDSLDEEHEWKIVGVLYAATNTDYGPIFKLTEFTGSTDTAVTQAYIDEMKVRSIYNTGVDASTSDYFLTLVTETGEFYGARFVVFARMVRQGEDDKVDTSKITKDAQVLMPGAWYSAFGGSAPNVVTPYTSLNL